MHPEISIPFVLLCSVIVQFCCINIHEILKTNLNCFHTVQH